MYITTCASKKGFLLVNGINSVVFKPSYIAECTPFSAVSSGEWIDLDMLIPFLGRLLAALYCFYFHRKCPERPERCLDIYIYVNNMADAKSVRNLSALFR